MSGSVTRTLTVATLVAVVCSLLVSSTATLLKPRQMENRSAEKKRNVLQAAGIYIPGQPVSQQFHLVEPILVELQTGRWSPMDDPETFLLDYDRMMKDPEQVIRLSRDRDPAGIRIIPRKQLVYRIPGGESDTLVLPVWGKGLWSTMYGFLAVDAATLESKGLTFYEHGETPGLGGEVDNPNWKAHWPGKHLFGPEGNIRIQVIKGAVNPGDPDARYKVDGLSGATITTRGVHELVRFWLGPDGFGPFLSRLVQNQGGGGRS